MLERCDFRARRKEGCESISLMLTGRLFQMSGPQTEKARRPNWVEARVLTFQMRDYILACHTSPSCVICFVASLTKIPLNSIKNLHFTGTEPYRNWRLNRVFGHDIITSRHECEATPTAAPQPMSARDLQRCMMDSCDIFQCHIHAMWHWNMSHGTWLNLDQ